MIPGGLGLLLTDEKPHVDKYPLTADAVTKPVPVVLGIPWYSAFDHPVKDSDGRYWIGRDLNNLGFVRGGHAIVVRPASMGDTREWYLFYNQGATGECVGFSSSRMMSLLNRAKYDAPWLYFATQDRAGQPRNPYSGTYLFYAMDVLRNQGHKVPKELAPPSPYNGIKENRWAQSVDDILACLKSPFFERLGGVPLLNSWGDGYPQSVFLPFETLDYVVFKQNGEATMVTDR